MKANFELEISKLKQKKQDLDTEIRVLRDKEILLK